MAVVVLLFEAGEGADLALRADSIGRLTQLGITNVTVLRDDRSLVAVLEGWALDPTTAAACAAATLAGRGRPYRALHELVQAAVAARPGDCR